ncbi:HK97 family phage prohead protease [Hwanghaeella sp.]|uniref:HK97 family phage prohead protease n=1 Tax=Hwanghaeella sp. TaxID=2605943 RepID=UPI003CCBC88D
METQTFDYSFETKALDDKSGEFEGYASTFGNVDQGGDVVEAGAFIEGIVQAKKDGRNIPMLWQHDRHEPIGVWSEIVEDSKGLKVKGRLLIDDDPLARRAYGHLKAKSIGGMSIGYRIPAGGMEEDKNRRGVFRLKKIDLREISLVTMPMNTAAKVTSVKSILEAGGLPSLPEFEKFLREAGGFSISQAKAIAGNGLSHLLGQREVGGGGDDSEAAAFFRALRS